MVSALGPSAAPGIIGSDRAGGAVDETHTMTVETDDEREVIFACDDPLCGRRVRLGRTGGFEILEQGDFDARHAGATGPLTIGAGLGGG